MTAIGIDLDKQRAGPTSSALSLSSAREKASQNQQHGEHPEKEQRRWSRQPTNKKKHQGPSPNDSRLRRGFLPRRETKAEQREKGKAFHTWLQYLEHRRENTVKVVWLRGERASNDHTQAHRPFLFPASIKHKALGFGIE
jgi:hypothetical protein